MSDLPYYARTRFRIATLAIGVLLSCLGIYVLLEVPDRIAGAILGLVLVAFGVESMVAATRGRLSLLAKIGPLP